MAGAAAAFVLAKLSPADKAPTAEMTARASGIAKRFILNPRRNDRHSYQDEATGFKPGSRLQSILRDGVARPPAIGASQRKAGGIS
ncbi:hypothetical protein K32_43330 [Kaistia sp. 32K]|nr:hypothetical protein K32_43330 [Kaistia sp. 32K]